MFFLFCLCWYSLVIPQHYNSYPQYAILYSSLYCIFKSKWQFGTCILELISGSLLCLLISPSYVSFKIILIFYFLADWSILYFNLVLMSHYIILVYSCYLNDFILFVFVFPHPNVFILSIFCFPSMLKPFLHLPFSISLSSLSNHYIISSSSPPISL